MRKTLLSLLSLFLGFSFSLRAEIVTDASVDYTTLEEYPYSSTSSRPTINDGVLEIVNETATTNYWNLQYFIADDISFNSNAIYTVTTEIKGSEAGSIHIVLGTWQLNVSKTIAISTEWTQVTLRLSGIPTCTGAHVMLQSGDYIGTIQVRNCTVTHNKSTETLTIGNIIDSSVDYSKQTAYYSWKQVTDNTTIGLNNGYLEVVNTAAASANYLNQYVTLSTLPIVIGNDYKVTLEIQGDVDGSIDVAIGDYSGSQRVTVAIPITASDEVQTITARYLNIKNNEIVIIQSGKYVGTLKIKSVTVSHDEDFTAKISDLGVASLYLPGATTIPEGITAYTAAYDAAKSTLTLSKIEDGILPANTGVIIEGAAGEYNFDAAFESGSATSDLLGNATADAITITPAEGEAILVLDQVNEQLGFYNWKSGVIPAYKAYLKVKTASEAPAVRIVYGDEPGNVTGIENVRTAQSVSAPIFNLAGQRVVSRTAPGLYIQGGKKILVK
jgi:hypothetical protein